MEGWDWWRLCDELSVIQAALLIAGRDPSSDANYVEGWPPEKRPPGYEAAKTAIANALRSGAITGQLILSYEYETIENAGSASEGPVDLYRSRVEVESLRNGWRRVA
jgi:hypothetical protein